MPKLVLTVNGKEIDVDAKELCLSLQRDYVAGMWTAAGQGPIRPIAYVDGHVTDITVLPYGTAQIATTGPTAPPAERSLAAAIPDILAAIRDIREEARERFDALTAMLVDLEDQVKWIADEARDEPLTAGIGPGVKVPQYEDMTRDGYSVDEVRATLGRESWGIPETTRPSISVAEYEGMTREYQDVITGWVDAVAAPGEGNATQDGAGVPDLIVIPEGAPVHIEAARGPNAGGVLHDVHGVWARDVEGRLRDLSDGFDVLTKHTDDIGLGSNGGRNGWWHFLKEVSREADGARDRITCTNERTFGLLPQPHSADAKEPFDA